MGQPSSYDTVLRAYQHDNSFAPQRALAPSEGAHLNEGANPAYRGANAALAGGGVASTVGLAFWESWHPSTLWVVVGILIGLMIIPRQQRF